MREYRRRMPLDSPPDFSYHLYERVFCGGIFSSPDFPLQIESDGFNAVVLGRRLDGDEIEIIVEIKGHCKESAALYLNVPRKSRVSLLVKGDGSHRDVGNRILVDVGREASSKLILKDISAGIIEINLEEGSRTDIVLNRQN